MTVDVDVRFGVRPPREHAFVEEEPRASPHETIREEPRIDGKVPLRDRPAVPPDPIAEIPKPPQEGSMTIRERAERRLKNWPKEG